MFNLKDKGMRISMDRQGILTIKLLKGGKKLHITNIHGSFWIVAEVNADIKVNSFNTILVNHEENK